MMKRGSASGVPLLLKKVPSKALQIGDSLVRSTSCAKNLGVLFDSEMNMHKFIHQKVSAAMYYLRSIARCHRYLTLDATKALVHAYVTSRLDYCNSLLLGLAKKSINKLQRIQNVAARVVMRVSKEVDSKSLLHQLHWLPIWKRIIYKNLLLLFKAMNGNSPEYLMDLLPPLRITSKHTRSSCAPLFLEARTFSKFGDRCFQNSVPKLWNKLPPSL